ncbi:MAG: hypothetical protein V9E99_05185 [Microthrixaceae bacterium]|jgi:hypothetical protein
MRKVAEGDRCAGIQHPFELTVRHPEGRCGVGYVVELLTVGADLGVSARAQRGSPSGRALGGDESFVGVWVATSEHRCEVRTLHRASEPGAVRRTTEPSPRLLAVIRVVPLRTATAGRR